jgi:GNAT superfamily N-acetyltransferase
MASPDILQSILLEAEYACFNRRRTLRDATEGMPSIHADSHLIQIKDPTVPLDTYVNRLIVADPAASKALPEISRQYEAQGLAHAIDVLPHVLTPELSAELIRGGFTPVRELLFLHMKPEAILPTPAVGISIKRIGSGEGPIFLDTVIASIGRTIAPAVLAAKRHFYESPSFICYLAYCDDKLAGLATLYHKGDRAWMANAFTFESFRGRGVQSALIQRRIQDAAALGVATLLTDVEFLTASYRNLQRLGFGFHYAATSWERLPV